MKKTIYSMMVLSMLMLTVSPVLATCPGPDCGTPQGIDTEFTITGGSGGDNPLVKVKWEEERQAPSLESGDPSHYTHGSQFLPPLVKGADKMITICTVVTDEQGLGTIATVKAWVDAPRIDKYCDDTDLGSPWILESQYDPQTEAAAAIARFQNADRSGLTTYTDYSGIDYAEVIQELNNGSAEIFCGDFPLNYEDPAGEYTVEVKAQDTDANWGFLTNTFDYIGVAGFEVDFRAINYNTVTIGDEKMVDGDGIFDPSDIKPTVRSVGNVRLQLTVSQDEMGLPLESDIAYAARMGNTMATKVPYGPNQTVTLPEVLELSSQSKMDFWITVFQTIPDQEIYRGAMTIGCMPVPFPCCGGC